MHEFALAGEHRAQVGAAASSSDGGGENGMSRSTTPLLSDDVSNADHALDINFKFRSNLVRIHVPARFHSLRSALSPRQPLVRIRALP